ncbi:hypothetical protein D9611_000713 [Ephemerocybe angulata]|uniref:ATP-dependent DNA helicase n=1 Tax=Ephemerocybe angulata TaxID=980116 RepID=A0A8H5BNS5_9AGAR|nr:hypothetical protein D9611_000713 [Tulosesus angulatus]
MLVWLDGALNPDEIKHRIFQIGDTAFQERLLAFLDDTIATSIPDDPGDTCPVEVQSAFHHPCSVRGVNLEGLSEDAARLAKQKDTHHLATQCQRHTHSKTCYKYWRGPPHPKECRFNLDEGNTRLVSEFDKETEELSLRSLDGLVNNYNDTILRAVRCNMDIKFVGSGNTAKAVCYYITDYITKSQLKTHVAFAALELASRKLGEYDPNEDDLQTRGKRLLQRCAYSMVSHQELSAQQAVSYLMGFEDHFTSHQYHNLYWTSFERLVDENDPLGYAASHNKTKGVADSNPELDSDIEGSVLEDEGGGDEKSQYSNEMDEVQPEEENEDEVGVRVDGNTGELVLRTSQVNDYLLRGDRLKGLSLWDFVAQVDKVAISTDARVHKHRDNRPEEYSKNGNCYDEDDSEDMEWEASEDHQSTISMAEMLLDTHRLRPRSQLKEAHPDSRTHCLRVRLPTQRYVPVPIGPAIPRRDSSKPEDIERHSRLMLILFKPWQNPDDLRKSSLQSWAEALADFLQYCSPADISRMGNMQVLHECKDSRDDHFARRSKEKWRSGFAKGMGREHRTSSGNRDDFADEDDEYSAILDHLESIEKGADGRLQLARRNAAECITEAENSGMFDDTAHETGPVERTVPGEGIDLIDENHMDDGMEDIWRAAYEDRRAGRVPSQPIKEPTAIDEGASTPTSQVATIIACAPLPRKRSQKSSLPDKIPLLGLGLPSVQQDVNIDDVIHKFTLNSEQGRAFKIIAGQASEQNLVPPLRMFLGGAGGTGKSRVLDALKEFFTSRGERHRLRLASFTGVAASNISGSTLHSALSLVQRKSKAGADKSKRNLIALWEGVDFLFIDEVSMIGCKLLFQISNALVDAKGNTAPFGGINIIFAGDFAQLPPVGQRRLSCKMDRTRCPKSEEDLGGQLLWHSVETVVILTEVVRQSGKVNEAFVELLGRLREGRCSNDDYEVLMGRTIQNVSPDWNMWQDAPIIVSNNAAKDALNERAALAFAQRTGRELHWYYATDTRLRQPIGDSKLRDYLHSLDSGRTGHRQGRVPLVVGMPVMVMQNFDVEGGIVNGTTGTLKRVRYRLDDDGLRHAISCVVDSPAITADVLPGLEASCAAVLEDTIDLRFVNPYSGKRCTIKRTQLPISPGFAMTAHKAQGKTFERAIVDLTCCIGTEAPYVMVSRVKSLSGLLVLRAFSKQKITCRQSQETRDEMKRLESFRLKTVVEHGSEEEAEDARTMLQSLQRITRTAARKRSRECKYPCSL